MQHCLDRRVHHLFVAPDLMIVTIIVIIVMVCLLSHMRTETGLLERVPRALSRTSILALLTLRIVFVMSACLTLMDVRVVRFEMSGNLLERLISTLAG